MDHNPLQWVLLFQNGSSKAKITFGSLVRMDWSLASPFLLSSYVSEILFYFKFIKKTFDRDAGGSVVVKRRRMETTLSPLQLSSSLLRRNHPLTCGYSRKSIQVGFRASRESLGDWRSWSTSEVYWKRTWFKLDWSEKARAGLWSWWSIAYIEKRSLALALFSSPQAG